MDVLAHDNPEKLRRLLEAELVYGGWLPYTVVSAFDIKAVLDWLFQCRTCRDEAVTKAVMAVATLSKSCRDPVVLLQTPVQEQWANAWMAVLERSAFEALRQRVDDLLGLRQRGDSRFNHLSSDWADLDHRLQRIERERTPEPVAIEVDQAVGDIFGFNADLFHAAAGSDVSVIVADIGKAAAHAVALLSMADHRVAPVASAMLDALKVVVAGALPMVTPGSPPMRDEAKAVLDPLLEAVKRHRAAYVSEHEIPARQFLDGDWRPLYYSRGKDEAMTAQTAARKDEGSQKQGAHLQSQVRVIERWQWAPNANLGQKFGTRLEIRAIDDAIFGIIRPLLCPGFADNAEQYRNRNPDAVALMMQKEEGDGFHLALIGTIEALRPSPDAVAAGTVRRLTDGCDFDHPAILAFACGVGHTGFAGCDGDEEDERAAAP